MTKLTIFIFVFTVFGLYTNCGKVFESNDYSSYSAKPGHINLFGQNTLGEKVKREIPYEVVSGQAIINGDIIIGPDPETSELYNYSVDAFGTIRAMVEDKNQKGVFQAVKASNEDLWPTNTIYIGFEEGLSSQIRGRFIQAIRLVNTAFQGNVNIRFTYGDESDAPRDYIRVTEDGRCAAHIGYRGGRQSIFASRACTVGNYAHEMFHSLGLRHEQQHPDALDYLVINRENIIPGKEHNFRASPFDVATGSYNMDSIMHYGRNFFSVNGRDTITMIDRNNNGRIGQRTRVTDGDVAGLAEMYPVASQGIATNLPSVVRGLRLAGISTSQFSLQWARNNSSENISNYKVYITDTNRRTTERTTRGNSFTVTGLAAGSEYSIKVTALNDHGEGPDAPLNLTTHNRPPVSNCVDTPPFDDDWGWDGSASCRLSDSRIVASNTATTSSNNSSSANTGSNNSSYCIMPDQAGNSANNGGYGWTGVRSCVVKGSSADK